MVLRNWIELIILMIVVITGIIVKYKTKKWVKDIEGFDGIAKPNAGKEDIIGRL